MNRLPIKICGVTRPEQAAAIAALGVNAVGLVFFPPSPRHVTEDLARAILAALPADYPAVGVLVGEPPQIALARAQRLGLRFLQLHGDETPETAETLQKHGIRIIKALNEKTAPLIEQANRWPLDVPLLVECPMGPLPGGAGIPWAWEKAAPLAARRSIILAGGLTPANAAQAAEAVRPAALDVSSGVEDRPGIKSLEKIRALLDNLARLPWTPPFPSPWAASKG